MRAAPSTLAPQEVTVDRDAVWTFMERFVDLASGAATIMTLAVADRTGLLAVLADGHPRTMDQAAGDAGLDGRYTREILSQLVAASVLEFDARSGEVSLPAEHATVIADDASPYAMAGWLDMLSAAAPLIDDIATAARQGGGVSADRYPDRWVRGVARANSPGMRILLTRRWLPALPDVVERLQEGARVADIGCGSGAAALAMAAAYPRSEVIGFDIDPRALSAARAAAATAGLGNVSFVHGSVGELPLDPPFDLVTAFDVVHDLADPSGALRRIRDALAPGGSLLMMEPALSARLEKNVGGREALFYGVSLLHCMTQSLAVGGAGLGAAWGPEKAEELCRAAGFTTFRRVPIDNPFSAFFDVRP